MPIFLIGFLITDLLSIAIPFIAFYLWREWDKFNGTSADDYADRCLYGAIALALLILIGRFLVRALLSKERKGEDEPTMVEATQRDLLNRPDGSRINIEYYGKENGQPIIFVHGLNANIKNWYYQRKYFSKNFRLIMMDLPGMGRSTRPSNNDYSLHKLAGDLKAVIEHSGAHNAILWGHSLGGMTILSLLAKKNYITGLQIKGVILEHTTYTNPLRTIIFSRIMLAIQKPILIPLCYAIIFLSPLIWLIRWMGYLNGNAHMMTRLLTFAGTQTSKQLEFTTLLSTLTPPAVMARGCLGMFGYDVTKDLRNITVPALIIGADKDLLTKPDASVYMKENLPHAGLEIVSPANHLGLIERHQQVNEKAENFINKLL